MCVLLFRRRPLCEDEKQHNHNVEALPLLAWLSLCKHSMPNSDVISSGWTLCCAALHEATRVKGRRWKSAGVRIDSADAPQIGDFFYFHFDFVENLCMLCCLLKHGSVLEQALQLLTACVIVFHQFRLCPSHEMKEPIKALWLGRADRACVAAGTWIGCSGSVEITEDDNHYLTIQIY